MQNKLEGSNSGIGTGLHAGKDGIGNVELRGVWRQAWEIRVCLAVYARWDEVVVKDEAFLPEMHNN
jgi:hypothetical protein